MAANDTLARFVNEQGWNEASQINVLCRFIDEYGDEGLQKFSAFLQEIADFENKDASGDDLCDLCMTSGVHAERTTPCGKTIGIECGCDESHEDGKCDNPECEACKDKCETCGEEMDHDCNGNARCPNCDPPCPCCSDGPGPV